jgi:hypothetical protein
MEVSYFQILYHNYLFVCLANFNLVAGFGGWFGPFLMGYMRDLTGDNVVGLAVLSASLAVSIALFSVIQITQRNTQVLTQHTTSPHHHTTSPHYTTTLHHHYYITTTTSPRYIITLNHCTPLHILLHPLHPHHITVSSHHRILHVTIVSSPRTATQHPSFYNNTHLAD